MTTSAAARVDRDRFVATKLHVPRPRVGFVSRPRLLARLDEGMARELTLVCTPAGFGKTTLLGDWARRRPRPVAWLSLDSADNDPVRFWRHIGAALDQVRPGLAGRLDGLLGGRRPTSFEAVAEVVANELADVTDDVVLILDDYHLIDLESNHRSLAFLLEHAPSCLHLILASRVDPPLPLARLRARAQLVELRGSDLRFTHAEATRLLRAAVGADFPEAAAAILEERTEGWAAGLQLATASLRSGGDVGALVADFSGNHRHIMDYLAAEVLDNQPEHIREFLLTTSVLDGLSGPVCDALTGRTDGQELLETVERANLFLIPLDDVRGWWRYHHLFAELLRARLAQRRPERVADLHRAAASWFDRHGLAEDAVRHAFSAGDPVFAARLIERHFDALLQRGEDVTLRWWLRKLPADVVRSRPRLCLAKALWAMIGSRLEAAEKLLADAEHGLATADEEPYEPSVDRTTSLVANIPAGIAALRAGIARTRGDAETTTRLGRQAVAHLTRDDEAVRAQVEWFLAVADWQRGRLREAEAALEDLVQEQRTAGALRYMALRSYDLGELRRARGQLGAAVRTHQRALEACGPNVRVPSAGMAHVGLAWALYDRGDLDAALRHATDGVGLCRQAAEPRPLVAGLAIMAWIRHVLGDHAGAMDLIAEAEGVELSPTVASLLNPAPSVRARLALATDDAAEAVRWADARGFRPDDHISYPREREYLTFARILLATDRAHEALALVERLGVLAAAQERTGSLIEVRALHALAFAATGNERAASSALVEAVALASREGHLRVFLDEGAPMARLFARVCATRASRSSAGFDRLPRPYLGRLVDAFRHAGYGVVGEPRRGRTAGLGPVEPLTAREVEVLHMVATGRSNSHIAGELVVTLDTVKKHVSHVLDKLGAANRTEAVARAREMGLLS